MIFFGFLLLVIAGAGVAFALPLGPAPAAVAVGVGATMAMLLVMSLLRTLYALLSSGQKSCVDHGRERHKRAAALG